MFTPQPIATAAASLMIATQLWLVLSGNFSWLNWITIVTNTALLLWLSHRPVRNMVSRRQIMNRSFEPLQLVHSYGAFGAVGRIRHEAVIEGMTDAVPREVSDWRKHEFKGKPGEPRRWPRRFAPYHLRLDWMTSLATLSPGYADPWVRRPGGVPPGERP